MITLHQKAPPAPQSSVCRDLYINLYIYVILYYTILLLLKEAEIYSLLLGVESYIIEHHMLERKPDPSIVFNSIQHMCQCYNHSARRFLPPTLITTSQLLLLATVILAILAKAQHFAMIYIYHNKNKAQQNQLSSEIAAGIITFGFFLIIPYQHTSMHAYDN